MSLELIEREFPPAHAAMCARLAPRTVALDVDGDRTGLRFEPERVHWIDPDAPCDVVVRSSRRAILAVVDGEASLTDAVLDERLAVQGSPDDLVAFHEAFLCYVHGAVRAPSFPRLLEAYRAAPNTQED